MWNALISAQRLKMQDAYRLRTHYLDMLQDGRTECVQLRMMYNRLEIKIYSRLQVLDCEIRNPCITKSHQAWAINLRVIQRLFIFVSTFHHLYVTVCRHSILYIRTRRFILHSTFFLHTQLFLSQFSLDRMSRNLWFPIHFKVQAEIEF